jgi:NTP pyrophosphatase (non-canonical NTP hydrolase)
MFNLADIGEKMNTVELIKQWGRDRGITVNGTHQGQWYKLISEFGELADSLAKGSDPRDDIGDMFVVLVMICEIRKVDIDQALNMARLVEFENAEVYELMGWLLMDIQTLQYQANVGRAVKVVCILTAIAEAHGHTLEDCMEIAYNDIKDRKGYLSVDGVFIKESAA